MRKGKDYGLLIASMVAIVAIVGLVIMFSSGTTGAITQADQDQRCYRSTEGLLKCGDPLTGEEYTYIAAGFGQEESSGAWQPQRTQANVPFKSDNLEHKIVPGTTEVTQS